VVRVERNSTRALPKVSTQCRHIDGEKSARWRDAFGAKRATHTWPPHARPSAKARERCFGGARTAQRPPRIWHKTTGNRRASPGRVSDVPDGRPAVSRGCRPDARAGWCERRAGSAAERPALCSPSECRRSAVPERSIGWAG